MGLKRGAAIPVSLELLKILLDLPAHLHVVGVEDASARGIFLIRVTGPWCPELPRGLLAPAPAMLTLTYDRVETGKAHLIRIEGLDT